MAAAKPAHPKYLELIREALLALKERNGSSLQAVKKYFSSNFAKDLKPGWEKVLSTQLRNNVANGKLVKVTPCLLLLATNVRCARLLRKKYAIFRPSDRHQHLNSARSQGQPLDREQHETRDVGSSAGSDSSAHTRKAHLSRLLVFATIHQPQSCTVLAVMDVNSGASPPASCGGA
ncbi:hypothetical protein MMC07_002623 [Pseudocyphellaria aurata]|nr:hypothetical protein [Pseudocyphellaria aurata]